MNKDDVSVRIQKGNRWHTSSKLSCGGFIYKNHLFLNNLISVLDKNLTTFTRHNTCILHKNKCHHLSMCPESSASLIHFRSVAQSCLTLCNPMDCSTPGLPVHHQLPEFTHTHVHHIGDAIRPSHPLSSPSPLTFSLSQHQGLFK